MRASPQVASGHPTLLLRKEEMIGCGRDSLAVQREILDHRIGMYQYRREFMSSCGSRLGIVSQNVVPGQKTADWLLALVGRNGRVSLLIGSWIITLPHKQKAASAMPAAI